MDLITLALAKKHANEVASPINTELTNLTTKTQIVGTRNNLIQNYGDVRFKFADAKNTIYTGAYTSGNPGNVTLGNHTYDSSISKISDRSIKITDPKKSNASGLLYTGLNLTFLDTDMLGVWVYVPREELKKVLSISILLSNWNDTTFLINATTLRFVKPCNASGVVADTNNFELSGGWNFLKFKKTDSDITPSSNQTIFNTMLIQVQSVSASSPGSVWFDSFEFNFRLKPTILLNFDSASSNKYTTVYPLLKSYGFPATFVLDPDFAQITLTQLRTMLKDGWDYSIRPNGTKNSTTTEALKDIYDTVMTKLSNNNVPVPTTCFTENNVITPLMKQLLPSYGFKLIRTSPGNNTFLDEDTIEISTEGLSNSVVASVQSKIAKCISYGTMLGILTHDLTATDDSVTNGTLNTTVANYTTILNTIKPYVDLGQVQVITFKDLCYQAFSPIKTKQSKRVISTNYNKSSLIIPSATANTFGTTIPFKAPANYSYCGISPQAIDVVFGGTFGTETITAKMVISYSDGTTATITKTATEIGTTSFTNSDLMSLVKDGVYIVQSTFSCSSTIASSTANVTFNRCGVYI